MKVISYKHITWYFGLSLSDRDFQAFLTTSFSDLTEYNILENDCIISSKSGIEFGFINNEAIYDDDDNILLEKGNPIFSYFILYSKSSTLIDTFPFDANFTDSRIEIIKKAGNPTQTKEGYIDFLNKRFLVDNYKVDDIVITFDYDHEKHTINSIQVRDNNLITNIKL